MKRRDFITLLGGAAAPLLAPLAARAQPAMPVIGFLGTRSLELDAHLVAVFRQNLAEAGFVEGRNLRIEYRFTQGQNNRLPAMAADLVSRRVAVIVASTTPAAQAAKDATSTIPVVFTIGVDPVTSGLVASLNRPSGNLTGVTTFIGELGTKQFGLLQELLPVSARFGYLDDPTNRFIAEAQRKPVEIAARASGRELVILNAGTARDIDMALASLGQQRIGGLLVGASAFFATHLNQIVVQANHHGVPTVYPRREFVEAGGLMSYGTSFVDAFRQLGRYVGRILKGAKPTDLPVLLPTQFEFVINLKAAKAIGVEIPPGMSARADEVIE